MDPIDFPRAVDDIGVPVFSEWHRVAPQLEASKDTLALVAALTI